MRTLFVSAIALGLVAVFVAVTFGLDKGKLSEGFAREDTAQLSGIQVDGDLFTRQTKHIPVAGALNIEGWLYLPRQPSEKFRESIVLLGHGLGAQKDFGLEMYASMYAAEGLAAMSFDYRTFGGSDGEPRNLILPSMQVEDWKAVFAFAKSLGYSRIVLHGTSYAGGHVVTAASQLGEDNALLGVISQVPYLGGPGGKKANIERRGIGGVLQLILLWLLDLRP